jgi:hypothetical protein
MATTSQSTEKATIWLDGPNDYLDWISEVKRRALQRGVWNYIDPDQSDRPVLSEPTGPDPTTYASASVASQALDEEREVDFGQLTPTQKTEYRFAWDRYQHQLKQYQSRRNGISEVYNWVSTSISPRCRIYIARCTELPEVLDKLKAKIQPTDHAYELSIIKAYSRIKTIAKNQKIEDWIDRWEEALEKATLLGLPEVQGDRPIWDFLEAIKPINPYFYQVYLQQMNDAGDRNIDHLLTGPILAKRFRS